MEYAKKYALVPQESFSKHIPNEKQMTELDRQMSQILNSKLSDYEKVQQYYDLLRRKMNLEDFNTPWSSKQDSVSDDSPKAIKNEDYDQTIINAVPTPMKHQGQNLLKLLKSHPEIIRWNEKGELFYNNQIYPKTNLADLFRFIFTHTKPNKFTGETEFLNALQQINAPKQFIVNKYAFPIKQESSIKQETPSKKHQKGKSIVSKQKRKSIVWESF